MSKSSSAPCESHPCGCNSCAWEPAPVGSAHDPKRRLEVVRTDEQYGCVRKNASVVVDRMEGKPFMRIGEALHPLSATYGAIIADTRLERDIRAALA